jgi:uncharacterized protein YbbK (DUF523 family)
MENPAPSSLQQLTWATRESQQSSLKNRSTEDIRDTIENKAEELLATIERAEVTLGILKTQRD